MKSIVLNVVKKYGVETGKEFPYSRVGLILTDKYLICPIIGTTLIGGMNYDRNEAQWYNELLNDLLC